MHLEPFRIFQPTLRGVLSAPARSRLVRLRSDLILKPVTHRRAIVGSNPSQLYLREHLYGLRLGLLPPRAEQSHFPAFDPQLGATAWVKTLKDLAVLLRKSHSLLSLLHGLMFPFRLFRLRVSLCTVLSLRQTFRMLAIPCVESVLAVRANALWSTGFHDISRQ